MEHELKMQYALQNDDQLGFLVAMRDSLVERYVECSPGESSGLSKQIIAVCKKIQEVRDEEEAKTDDMSEFEQYFNTNLVIGGYT